MINLLSDERKNDIRAARANVILVRYTALIGVALAFVCAALYVSYYLLQVEKKGYDTIVEVNSTDTNTAETKAKVAELSSQLGEAKSLLDQEIRYSEVLTGIGQLTPKNTVLGEFKIDSTTFSGTPTDIIAYAKSTSDATTLQTQFQNSPIFSQVTLKTTEDNAGIDEYPVKVTLSVTLNRTRL